MKLMFTSISELPNRSRVDSCTHLAFFSPRVQMNDGPSCMTLSHLRVLYLITRYYLTSNWNSRAIVSEKLDIYLHQTYKRILLSTPITYCFGDHRVIASPYRIIDWLMHLWYRVQSTIIDPPPYASSLNASKCFNLLFCIVYWYQEPEKNVVFDPFTDEALVKGESTCSELRTSRSLFPLKLLRLARYALGLLVASVYVI